MLKQDKRRDTNKKEETVDDLLAKLAQKGKKVKLLDENETPFDTEKNRNLFAAESP